MNLPCLCWQDTPDACWQLVASVSSLTGIHCNTLCSVFPINYCESGQTAIVQFVLIVTFLTLCCAPLQFGLVLYVSVCPYIVYVYFTDTHTCCFFLAETIWIWTDLHLILKGCCVGKVSNCHLWAKQTGALARCPLHPLLTSLYRLEEEPASSAGLQNLCCRFWPQCPIFIPDSLQSFH